MNLRTLETQSRSRNLLFFIGIGLLGFLLVAMAILFLSRPFSIQMDMLHRLEPPSPTFPLGTDDLGRDMVSCLIYGAAISLGTGVVVVTVSAMLGGLLGLVSGYTGGIVDTLIMRLVDILLAFPGILLAIALAAFLSHGPLTLILVLCAVGWVEYARLVRAEVLKYKQKEFILAAISYNASYFRILFKHLLPLVRPLIILQASLGISSVILVESSLNFLGIGMDPRVPTLGQLIDAGRNHLFDYPLLMVAPGIVLFIIIMAFVFMGSVGGNKGRNHPLN